MATKTQSPVPESVKKYLRHQGLTLEKYAAMTKQEKFKTWLRANGLTYESFARGTSLSYNTVFRWGQDREPRQVCVRAIAAKYPDCPLVTEA